MLELMRPNLEKIISKHQHGFYKVPIDFHELIEFYNSINNKIDNRETVAVAYFDLSKAFDKLDHYTLHK